MEQILQTAITAAKGAGDAIVNASHDLSSLTIEEKSINDFVSEVDRLAETIISDIIQSTYPDHSILGEEFGNSMGAADYASSEYKWIIDPLDGTTNFLRGIPHYAVSIALVCGAEVIVGVVYDPAKNELYTAVRGQGALLNGQKIACSSQAEIEGALLATGIPFSGELLARVDQFSEAMHVLLAHQTSGVRRLGAAALERWTCATWLLEGLTAFGRPASSPGILRLEP